MSWAWKEKCHKVSCSPFTTPKDVKIAQVLKHCIGITGVMDLNPIEVSILANFWGYFFKTG